MWILSFLLFMFCSLSIAAQSAYLHCGSLLDCRDEEVRHTMTIIVTEGVIAEIVSGYVSPMSDDIAVVDLKDYTVMPGFMDMHVHVEGQSGPKSYEEGFRLNDADVALKSSMYLKRTLMAGFTTVRDLGGSGVNVSLRNAVNQGYIDGPRIYTCEKSIATTGGHADPTNGVRKDLMKDPGPKEGVVNSVDDAAKAVRQRYKNGADVIKITATGGVLSVAKDGMGPQFTVEEVQAIVNTAEDYGFVTAAHAHGAEGMKRAVLGGIHSIEHGTFMTEEVMDLMIEKGTYYVPTIAAGKFVVQQATNNPQYFPAIIRKKALAVGPQIQATFAKAYKRGVKIAFGTDTGVSAHGDNAKEFEFMVEAGMPPYEAIKSATVAPADLLRISDQFGTLEVGKMADIVGVKGDPLEDIKLLQEIGFVMKGGIVYKND